MFMRVVVLTVIALAAAQSFRAQAAPFVQVKGRQFTVYGKPYYFVGANYWYGPLLGLEKDKRRGIERLRRELDFLEANGVTNLRLMAGAEGTGQLNGVTRVGPPLQPEQGKFDERVAAGLDLVLAEMGKRGMRAVIFLSNNWEWSGGFQQFLIWNGVIHEKWLVNKPSWDELRDNVSKFYSCTPCKDAYARQAAYILGRTNKITRVRYVDDPVIMAWEIANEPRPMRPAANEDYRKWIAETAAMIKSRDSNHLVTIGHEGRIGTESLELFEKVHANRNVDYLTIHIWPKNWGWFAPGKLAEDFPNAVEQTEKYIEENAAVAVKLNKPLVIEEFGLPRDEESFDPAAETTYRDRYFTKVLSFVRRDPYIAGANFWAFGGTARPRTTMGHKLWKVGDEYTGDPPMEEQGLNSVFDGDRSTWDVIRKASHAVSRKAR